jgi:CheY-like chemotaxis protein
MHEAADRLGAHHFLPKPILPEVLRRLLVTLTGNTVYERTGRFYNLVNADPDTDLNGMRVLLVEDNPINQQLAVELMESRGIEVEVAINGQEALDKLEAVEPDHYHAVLMDLQMPVMDGYEATRRLRADPRYFTLPVVAMTAHAMIEERERCQAIGMNDHLSKPIEPDEFYTMLARYYTVAVAKPSTSPAVPGDDTTPPNIPGLDTASGLRRAGNNRKLYSQMLSRFAGDYAGYGQTFARHFADAEWVEAERLAHTLKGLAGTLGANEVQSPAGELETACKARQAEAATAALNALKPLLTPLINTLQQHYTEHTAASTEAATTAHPGKLPDCLPQLLRLLGEGDSEAIDLWEKHHKEFASALSPQVAQRISTSLQNFEFDAAQALLDDIVRDPL